MFNDEKIILTEESLAAWLDGMMTPEEEEAFLSLCSSDSDLSMLLDANDDVVDSYESILTEGYELPEKLICDFPLPQVEWGSESVIFDDFPYPFADGEMFEDSEINHPSDHPNTHGHSDYMDGVTPENPAYISEGYIPESSDDNFDAAGIEDETTDDSMDDSLMDFSLGL